MTAGIGIDDVLSLIYRGANSSGSWDPALSAIREMFDASVVCLRISCRGTKSHEFLFATGPKIRHDVLAEWEANQRRVEAFPTVGLGEIRIRNWAEELVDNPIVGELLDYDVATTLLHCFHCQDGETYILNIARGEGDPAFSAHEIENVRQIGRHFREARVLRTEMIRSNLTNHFQAQALDRLGVAGILVDPFGNVMPLNQGAERLLASQQCLKLRRYDQLVAVNRANDRELQDCLAKILAGEVEEGKTFALSLEREGGRPVGLIVHSARSLCLTSHRREHCALLFVRDLEANFAIEPALVQKLFSFTPAEANLAIGLASGRRLEEIEGKLNIRHNTARAHLRSMFLKADVSRQAELVCLLANSVAPLGKLDDAVR